jgi:hypothetical protein
MYYVIYNGRNEEVEDIKEVEEIEVEDIKEVEEIEVEEIQIDDDMFNPFMLSDLEMIIECYK